MRYLIVIAIIAHLPFYGSSQTLTDTTEYNNYNIKFGTTYKTTTAVAGDSIYGVSGTTRKRNLRSPLDLPINTATQTALNGKQASGTYATGTGSANGTNTGDNAANTTYANDYRAANFVAGTSYLAPNGSAASLTNFPTLNQNTTGSAASLTTPRTINFKSFNGTANIISNAIVANTTVVTGTAARTITGAQIVAGSIQELTGTTGRTFTFDTGTNMSTAASPVTVGDTYYILIKSSGTSTGTITLQGASGMTLSSSAVIAIGTSRMCAITNTGNNAWTIY